MAHAGLNVQPPFKHTHRVQTVLHWFPGLGNLHGLSDALLLEICGHLDARTLSLLSCASKACYCFCATEDLWKAHVLEVRNMPEVESQICFQCVSDDGRTAHSSCHRQSAVTCPCLAPAYSTLSSSRVLQGASMHWWLHWVPGVHPHPVSCCLTVRIISDWLPWQLPRPGVSRQLHMEQRPAHVASCIHSF